MTTHIIPPAKSDPLYDAFKARMIANPAEANAVIQNEYAWPPDESRLLDMGDALWNLELRAEDYVKDAEEVAELFPKPGRDEIWLIQCRAARDAIKAIRQQYIEDSSAPDPFSDRPSGSSLS